MVECYSMDILVGIFSLILLFRQQKCNVFVNYMLSSVYGWSTKGYYKLGKAYVFILVRQKNITLNTIMFYKFNLYNDLFCFYIMLAVINDRILSIDSSSFSNKSNHKSNQNRNLLPINKNYCTVSKNQRNSESSNLISSIVHQMQENADGSLSCISIFANCDSFSESKKFQYSFLSYSLL